MIVGEKITRHGKVISIDAKTRTVVVEGEAGHKVPIVAPADSPNFDQIKVGDPVIATAILDRLLHHSKVVNIKGHSYRLKEHQTVKEQLKGKEDNQPTLVM